ncbi:MAG: hypothetical protein GX765_00325 [Candidatus Moranbacteria bacterium]|nr:hypothetical protein [Candidatus Moranbacteria bacterium]
MKKRIKIFVVLLNVLFIIVLWFYFTITRYDTILIYPHYLIGLNKPNQYYQKNIAPLLLKHGKEYNIRDVDISSWQIYQDQESKFKFKYPLEMIYSIENYEPNYGYGLTFFDNQNQTECYLSLESRGFGVGNKFLVKKRQSANFLKEKKENMMYIRSKDNNIYNIGSSIFYDYPYSQGSFTGITFWGNRFDQVLHFWSSGNNCSESLLKGIFATFEFID